MALIVYVAKKGRKCMGVAALLASGAPQDYKATSLQEFSSQSKNLFWLVCFIACFIGSEEGS